MKNLSDYYTEEERTRELHPTWIDDPFNRAFDDNQTELLCTSAQWRNLYYFGCANAMISVSDHGTYILGVKIIRDVPSNNEKHE